MRYVHAAVSMNPSAGVVRQMADEAQGRGRAGPGLEGLALSRLRPES